MNCSAIIVAGGKSQRFGKNKLLQPLLGKPLIYHTLKPFLETPKINEIILVSSLKAEEIFTNSEENPKKNIIFTQGGKERQDSVKAGLKKISPQTEIILIHDGARPLTTQKHIHQCIEKAKQYQSCSIARKITETIKIAKNNLTNETPNRENFWIVETPQGFQTQIIQNAYSQNTSSTNTFTDETSAVEKLGIKTYLIENQSPNPKITYPKDIASIEALLKNENPKT